MLSTSTQFIVAGALVGQPFIWIEHPLATLGTVQFYTLAALMLVLLLIGIFAGVIEAKAKAKDKN